MRENATVGHLVGTIQRRHTRVVEREGDARVLERRPCGALHTRVLMATRLLMAKAGEANARGRLFNGHGGAFIGV